MKRDFCERIGFPEEATDTFEEGYKKILSTANCAQRLFEAKKLFFEGDEKEYRSILMNISEATQIHRYTVDMIFLLYCAENAKIIYDREGISDDIYFDTMKDLTYKLWECKQVYGIWGTFVVWWYPDFYLAKRFALGRLQFEKREFPFDEYKGIVKHGDTVYNFHIPSGTPLSYELVLDSFKKAYSFYGIDGIMPIYLNSWLIYPPHSELFKSGSNLKRFYEMFDILGSTENQKNSDLWRIFSVPYSPDMDIDTLPENTSMQRSFKEYFKNGGLMGHGQGIILFDGQKIVNI